MKVVGISGVARVGKDTFFEAVRGYYSDSSTRRMAFADELKIECDDFLKKNIGISAFTEDSNEKALIRPFLVTYGSHLRRKLDADCWVNKVSETINKMKDQNKTVFITDVRYENEILWIKKKMNGVNIYIEREGIKPANDEELHNDKILRKKSDYIINVPNFKRSELKNKYPLFINNIRQLITK